MKRKVILISLCLAVFAGKGKTIQPNDLPTSEIKLQQLFSGISFKNPDAKNIQINDSILFLLEKTLQDPASFEYPFDSLKHLGKIISPDRQIRFFSWNLFTEGTNQYYGFVLRKTGRDSISLFRLTDHSAVIKDPATASLEADNWYGCLVYDIIEKKIMGETHYMLLGYDPENIFISRKLVDVLWFSNNKPSFGKAIFQYNKIIQHRIIFEYSAKAQMSLTWNKNMNMIVFDHLSPSDPKYVGNFQYYGPDFTYNALKFEKDLWELVENVDARNSE